MTDWDGDGKQDWHDDYVINEVIPDKESGGGGGQGSGDGCGTFLTVLIFLAIFLKIIGR